MNPCDLLHEAVLARCADLSGGNKAMLQGGA